MTTTSTSGNRAEHLAVHVLGGLDPDDLDAVGAPGRAWVVTSVTAAPRRRRDLGDGVAHLPGRAVADEAHRVDRLAGAAGGDEHADAGEVRPRLEQRPRPRARSRSGSASRPAPTSPPASRPDSGSTTCTPRRRSVARFSCTAACSHISVCIAGATSTGARVASSVAREQVVGDAGGVLAEELRGGRRDDDEVGALAEPRVRDRLAAPSKSEVRAGSDASAENVSAPTKRVASSVSTGADVRAGVDQAAADLDRLVRRDPAGDAEHDPPAAERPELPPTLGRS